MSALLVTFSLDDSLFAIEAARVQEILPARPLTPVPPARREVAGVTALRGRVVTAIDLRRRLALDDRRPPMHLVLHDYGGEISLLVDEVRDIVPFDEDLVQPLPPGVSGPARALSRGAVRVGDRVALLVDTERVIRVS